MRFKRAVRFLQGRQCLRVRKHLSSISNLNMWSVRLFAALLIGLLGSPADAPSSASSAPDPSSTERAASERVDRFGIEGESFRVEEGQVRWTDTFADLLTGYGVDYQTVVQLAQEAGPEFNVRQMRSGQPYWVYRNPWLQQVQYLVYQIDEVEYVVFDVQNPEQTHVGQRPVQREWTTLGGTIEGSFYEALVSNDGHPELALRLSEIFAWQIDFFRLRRGDSFQVLYERRTVGGEEMAPGQVVAAYFEHQGEGYYGFRFDDGTGVEYFDRQGQSLRRKLLKAPVRFTRISSQYTGRRYHPVQKRYRAHRGVDYAAPRGTPVRSVGNGIVQEAEYQRYNGNYVKIRHNGVYTSGYLHLSEIEDGVHPGTEVSQGETIGYVGSTGQSTGPHLHYQLWKHGSAIDPYSIDLPPSRPVNPRYQEAFQQLVNDLLPRLHYPSAFDEGPSTVS